tara:strand:+ start:2905 stop:3525 length:621 start_codon:yes stop_codon:yes gene_type:complete
MALTNYTELQTSIAEFLNRDDLTAKIPDFIVLAEAQMNAELRHWRMEKRATASLDSQYTAVPDDFIQPVRFSIIGSTISSLSQTDSKTITDLRTANNNPSGRPTEYTILDGSIEVYPIPDATYTLELLYYEKLDALNSGNTTNWVLTTYPNAYLYGSLLHSAPYLMEDQRINTWATFYQKAIDDINSEAVNSKTAAAGRRIKIRSY